MGSAVGSKNGREDGSEVGAGRGMRVGGGFGRLVGPRRVNCDGAGIGTIVGDGTGNCVGSCTGDGWGKSVGTGNGTTVGTGEGTAETPCGVGLHEYSSAQHLASKRFATDFEWHASSTKGALLLPVCTRKEFMSPPHRVEDHINAVSRLQPVPFASERNEEETKKERSRNI